MRKRYEPREPSERNLQARKRPRYVLAAIDILIAKEAKLAPEVWKRFQPRSLSRAHKKRLQHTIASRKTMTELILARKRTQEVWSARSNGGEI
mmetsp:Transcript_38907/g.54792  ORF Transcript_38907/g.54792 Transcript_38907/m.54792 type:complete len:93 (+) Transcript_38907:250-528(+)